MQYKTIVFGVLIQCAWLASCASFSEKPGSIEIPGEPPAIQYTLKNPVAKSFPYPLPTRNEADLVTFGDEPVLIGKVIQWDFDGDGVSEVLEFKDESSTLKLYDFDGDGKVDLIK